MVIIFFPLDFPIALHDLPQNYAQKIPFYNGDGNFTARQHVDRFDDYVDLELVDEDDIKMRLFVQVCQGRQINVLEIYLLGSLPHLRLSKLYF